MERIARAVVVADLEILTRDAQGAGRDLLGGAEAEPMPGADSLSVLPLTLTLGGQMTGVFWM